MKIFIAAIIAIAALAFILPWERSVQYEYKAGTKVLSTGAEPNYSIAKPKFVDVDLCDPDYRELRYKFSFQHPYQERPMTNSEVDAACAKKAIKEGR